MSTMSTIKQIEEIEVPEGYGLISRLDSTGDTRLMWDPDNKVERKAAEAAFNKGITDGMLVYRVDPATGDTTGEVITEFPKKAGKIIMVPRTVGG